MNRIRPPVEFEKSVVEPLLTSGLFSYKYQVITFAAALGYRAGSRRKLDKPGEGIRIEYFQNHGESLAIDVIALAESDDLADIAESKDEERSKLFEEYACGGLALIHQECFDSSLSAEEALLRLVKRYATTTEGRDQAVEDLW